MWLITTNIWMIISISILLGTGNKKKIEKIIDIINDMIKNEDRNKMA